MSTKSNEINATYIKLENDTDDDDDLIYENSLELNHKKEHYSTSTNLNSSLSSTYKGKIEVTSKGRRKIFDGVRWQILCRRPECRKQTNKKSLCITHYKEEYESNIRSSSWSNNSPSFHISSYQQHSFDNTKTRSDIEDQNNTITTTDITKNNRSIGDGYIKYMHSGRRFILKNNKWQPLCKYDNICQNTAKYECLCIKHYELNQQKQRNTLKIHNNNDNHRRSLSSIFDKHQLNFSNDNIKRVKVNDLITSSSVTEQFDINSNESSSSLTEPIIDNNLTSKFSEHELNTSSNKNLNITSSDYLPFNKSNSSIKTDQSVQTDLTIPLCCILHHENHLFVSSCKNNKSTSSILSYDTKPEPQSFDASFCV